MRILQVAQNINNSNMHQVYIRLITIMQNHAHTVGKIKNITAAGVHSLKLQVRTHGAITRTHNNSNMIKSTYALILENESTHTRNILPAACSHTTPPTLTNMASPKSKRKERKRNKRTEAALEGAPPLSNDKPVDAQELTA